MYAWRTRPIKTISLPFFSPIGGGVWGGAEQKIERKWFWSGDRRSDSGGDGAAELFARPLGRARKQREPCSHRCLITNHL